MFNIRQDAYPFLRSLCAIGMVLAATSAASADQFNFVYTGAFNNQDALNLTGAPTGSFFGDTPFTVNARFDTASSNIAAPAGIPGFVAYSPYAVMLTVGGTNYNVQTYNQNPTTGVTVAVFDTPRPSELIRRARIITRLACCKTRWRTERELSAIG